METTENNENNENDANDSIQIPEFVLRPPLASVAFRPPSSLARTLFMIFVTYIYGDLQTPNRTQPAEVVFVCEH